MKEAMGRRFRIEIWHLFSCTVPRASSAEIARSAMEILPPEEVLLSYRDRLAGPLDSEGSGSTVNSSGEGEWRDSAESKKRQRVDSRLEWRRRLVRLYPEQEATATSIVDSSGDDERRDSPRSKERQRVDSRLEWRW